MWHLLYNACVGVVLGSDFWYGKNAYTAAALNCTFVSLSWWSKNTCFENADAQNVFYYYCLCGNYGTHQTKHWKLNEIYLVDFFPKWD